MGGTPMWNTNLLLEFVWWCEFPLDDPWAIEYWNASWGLPADAENTNKYLNPNARVDSLVVLVILEEIG